MANWRDTYRRPKFWIIDARIALLILPTLFHLRWWTITLVLSVAAILYIAEIRLGLSPEGALRAFRRILAGPIRPALLIDRRRHLRDFLREPPPRRRKPPQVARAR